MTDYERLLIHGLFLHPEKFFDLKLQAEDIQNDSVRAIYFVVGDLLSKGKKVKWESIYVNTPKQYQSFAMEIAKGDMPPSDLKSIGEKIAEQARKRRILQGLNKIKQDANTFDSDVLVEDLAELYNKETKQTEKECDASSVVERFLKEQLANRKKGTLGWSFNIQQLDKEFVQLRPGFLMVIGGYTSVGKTALTVELIKRLGDNQKPSVVLFSTEMLEKDIMSRLIANYTGMNSNKVLAGNLYDDQWKEQDKAVQKIKERNLYIYDFVTDIDRMEQEIRRLKLQGKCDIVIIDFLQNVKSQGNSIYERMSKLAPRIQHFTLQQKISTICLSQIPLESAKEDKGILSFKGAGEIGDACDIGVMLTRSKEEGKEKFMAWETRKNRHGAKPCFALKFKDQWEGFTEWVVE